MPWKDAVVNTLQKHSGGPVSLKSSQPVGGGSINDTYRLDTSTGSYFVKVNSASRFPRMFEKEAMGLKMLSDTRVINVPEPVEYGEEGDTAFLILKFIKSASKATHFWDDFGQKLAALHQHSSDFFGLDHNNYIGSLHQSNTKQSTWTDFFRNERLDAQVKLARNEGKIEKETVLAFDRLYKRLDDIFPTEPPALLHGDLWGGNFMVDEQGNPVIIDPAVYYGHREMDLGMSQLFGGFDARFYNAYHQHYPLESGWKKRQDICNLYPLMVHVNLFGGGYLGQVKSILRRF